MTATTIGTITPPPLLVAESSVRASGGQALKVEGARPESLAKNRPSPPKMAASGELMSLSWYPIVLEKAHTARVHDHLLALQEVLPDHGAVA